MNMVLRRPILLSLPPHGGTPTGAPVSETASDPIEVIENMAHEAHNDARAALHALLAGAEGCGPDASSARVAQDEELADFLRRARDEIAPEAKWLLAQRVAE
jgi:hypothetical protein